MMPESIAAVEIIRQSHQGYSIKPFLLRGDDGSTYFVKGHSKAGGPALVSEVLGAEIGIQLGLPIPPWTLMHIPEELIGFSTIPNVEDLRGGVAFASRAVENASDYTLSSIRATPVELQRKILLFDWWVRNEDRCLGQHGGNVNLILDCNGELNVIDHNLAFDKAFDADAFMDGHVFRECRSFFRDLVVRQEHMQMLGEIIDRWGTITDAIPIDWLYRDAEHTEQTEPTVAERLEMLEMFREERFWGAL